MFTEHCKEELFLLVFEHAGCGLFDGGCLVFATALQEVIGGELAVLINTRGQADHACVSHNGLLIDFDTALRPQLFIEEFSYQEGVQITHWRSYQEGDLVYAVRDHKLVESIKQLLEKDLNNDIGKSKSRLQQD